MPGAFARHSALSFVAGVATTLGGFGSTIIVARMLGVEGAGIVAFAVWIVTAVIVVTDLGLGGALTRFLPELEARGDHKAAAALAGYLLRRQLLVVAGIVAGFAVQTALVAWHQRTVLPIGEDAYLHSAAFWAIVGAACATQRLASFVYGYLKGTAAFSRLAIVAAIGGALQIAAAVIGGWRFGATGAISAAVLGHIVGAGLIVSVRFDTQAIGADLRRRVNRYAMGSWASYVVTTFAWSRMELFFLQRSWGSEATGLFSVSLTLANLATQLPLLLTGALLPYMARHSIENGGERAREAYAVSMRLMALLIFPACFGAAAIAPRLLPTLFGPDFAPAVPTAVVLVSTAAFSAAGSVAVTYLFAVERTHVVFLCGLVGAALSVLVGLLIVPIYGPIAAALGRGATQTMLVVFAVWFIDRRLRCPAPYGALMRLLLAAATCGAAALFVSWRIHDGAGLSAAVAVGVAVYVIALKLFGGLSAADAGRLAVFADSTLPSVLRPGARTLLSRIQTSTSE